MDAPELDPLALEVRQVRAGVNRLAVEIVSLAAEAEELREWFARRGRVPSVDKADAPLDFFPSERLRFEPVTGGIRAGRVEPRVKVLSGARMVERPQPQRLPDTGWKMLLVAGVTSLATLLVGLIWAAASSATVSGRASVAPRPPLLGSALGTLDTHGALFEPAQLAIARASPQWGSLPPQVQVVVGVPDVRRSLSVMRFGVGSDVIDRELGGRADTFILGGSVVFWTHVSGGRPGDTIRHLWIYEGREMSSLALSVESPSWRTYSRHTLVGTGVWVVELRDSEGRLLACQSFRCEG